MTIAPRDADHLNASEPKIIFRVYGPTRYRAGIWLPNATGRSLGMSPAERESAGKEIASLVQVTGTPAP